VLVGEHFGCVKNQESVGEIACAENANAKKEFAERCGESLQAVQKSFLFFNGDGAFANEEPEAGYGDQAGNERVEKNLAVAVIGDFEKPERGERTEDGAERVHETLEAEGAAVSAGRDVRGEESFFGGRADAATEPGGGAGGQDLQRMGGEAERRGGDGGEGVTENCERLAVLESVGVMARGELGKAGEAVGEAFDDAEPGGAGSNNGEESRQDGGGGFVAPVGEERCEADAEDGAVKPVICGLGIGSDRVGHERESTGDSAKLKSGRSRV
jgi:hypothetical protein